MPSTSLTLRRSLGAICTLSAAAAIAASHSHASSRLHAPPAAHASGTMRSIRAESSANYGRLPLAFEHNEGQAARQFQYISRGSGYGLFLAPTQAVLALRSPVTRAAVQHAVGKPVSQPAPSVLRIRLLGANPHAAPAHLDPLPGVSNYFIGSNPAQWRTNIKSYAKVRYSNVYNGIDLVYYGSQQQLEYDWVVAPGADVQAIAFDVSGAKRTKIVANGDLTLTTNAGDVVERAPVVYQEISGSRRQVAGKFKVLTAGNSDANGQRIGFEVASYDHSRPLIIDPVMVYSTYLGGSGFNSANGIAVDSQGCSYIAGETSSTDLTLVTPIQAANHANTTAGLENAFVTKLNAAGTAIVYSTYLGGTKDDIAMGVAVDSSGDAYVAGLAESPDFPTANALYSKLPGTNGAGFVSKLNPSGTALLYSTYLGGSSGAEITGIAVDPSGNAYVAGGTGSTDFPTKNPIQSVNNGHGILGDGNIFITEFSADGSSLIYSTYYGGSGGDVANAIAVDATGNTYVTGDSNSLDFPVHNAFQSIPRGEGDAFALKLTPNGLTVVYATYLGGSLIDHAHAIAADAQGNAYVCGDTNSLDFPTKNPIYAANRNPGGVSTGWVSKLSGVGGLVWSTYLGGSGDLIGNGESVDAVAVDAAGEAFVTGGSSSPNFPSINAVHFVHNSNTAFVTKFNSTGSALLFSTPLGGTGGDVGLGIALDSLNNIYVAGQTRSFEFPTVSPVQAANNTNLSANGFVTCINLGITYQAVDVAAGGDGRARLLWSGQSGQLRVWSVSTPGAILTQGTAYGPVSGLTAHAVAGGTDGFERVLMTGPNGAAALWLLNPSNALVSATTLGPVPGFTALDVTVAQDNEARVLWANTTGSISIWTVANNGNVTQGKVYTNTGWIPRAIAAESGLDGFTRLLWNNNGMAQVWLMAADNTLSSKMTLGPVAGYTAIDVGAGSDSKTRLLWVNDLGSAQVWSVTDAGVATPGPVFGPVQGMNAVKLDSGPDGYTRLLWHHTNGVQELWELFTDNTMANSVTFGPY